MSNWPEGWEWAKEDFNPFIPCYRLLRIRVVQYQFHQSNVLRIFFNDTFLIRIWAVWGTNQHISERVAYWINKNLNQEEYIWHNKNHWDIHINSLALLLSIIPQPSASVLLPAGAAFISPPTSQCAGSPRELKLPRPLHGHSGVKLTLSGEEKWGGGGRWWVEGQGMGSAEQNSKLLLDPGGWLVRLMAREARRGQSLDIVSCCQPTTASLTWDTAPQSPQQPLGAHWAEKGRHQAKLKNTNYF